MCLKRQIHLPHLHQKQPQKLLLHHHCQKHQHQLLKPQLRLILQLMIQLQAPRPPPLLQPKLLQILAPLNLLALQHRKAQHSRLAAPNHLRSPPPNLQSHHHPTLSKASQPLKQLRAQSRPSILNSRYIAAGWE